MVFKLTSAQLNDLNSYASNDDSLPAAYKYLARIAAGKDPSQATLRFFEGAADVNAQTGKYEILRSLSDYFFFCPLVFGFLYLSFKASLRRTFIFTFLFLSFFS